jgi:arylformamidase
VNDLLDISRPFCEGMLVYPGTPSDPIFGRMPHATIAASGYAMEQFTLGSHTGTHLDAPSHVFPDGFTVDTIPPEDLNGAALVVDARPAGKKIDAAFLAKTVRQGCRRVLLRTANELIPDGEFDPDYACLTPDGADFLEANAVRLVGIDYLSIEGGDDPTFPVHRTLLGAHPPVYILEGLDLYDIEPGWYELLCLPLLIMRADGAPVRAMLRNTLL